MHRCLQVTAVLHAPATQCSIQIECIAHRTVFGWLFLYLPTKHLRTFASKLVLSLVQFRQVWHLMVTGVVMIIIIEKRFVWMGLFTRRAEHFVLFVFVLIIKLIGKFSFGLKWPFGIWFGIRGFVCMAWATISMHLISKSSKF